MDRLKSTIVWHPDSYLECHVYEFDNISVYIYSLKTLMHVIGMDYCNVPIGNNSCLAQWLLDINEEETNIYFMASYPSELIIDLLTYYIMCYWRVLMLHCSLGLVTHLNAALTYVYVISERQYFWLVGISIGPTLATTVGLTCRGQFLV